MAKNKTTETTQSVDAFLNTVSDDTKRSDSFRLVQIMQEVTGYDAKMWGTSIVGFGSYHYKYDSGHEGDAPLAGFSPRKAEFSLYLAQGYPEKEEMLAALGKHRAAVGCIYIKKLADVDETVLRRMIVAAVDWLKSRYEGR